MFGFYNQDCIIDKGHCGTLESYKKKYLASRSTRFPLNCHVIMSNNSMRNVYWKLILVKCQNSFETLPQMTVFVSCTSAKMMIDIDTFKTIEYLTFYIIAFGSDRPDSHTNNVIILKWYKYQSETETDRREHWNWK